MEARRCLVVRFREEEVLRAPGAAEAKTAAVIGVILAKVLEADRTLRQPRLVVSLVAYVA
jgi:hypothetical protein